MRDLNKILQTLAWMLVLAVVLTSAACGGGDEAAGPDSDAAPATTEDDASDDMAAADLERGNAAVMGLGDGDAGVSGTASFAGNVPNLPPVQMDADPQCASKHDGAVPAMALVLGDGNTMANVFVKVTNPPAGDWSAPSQPAVIDQEGCRYHPHVMGMLVGQELVFINSDGLLHNVHGLPKANRDFNLGMPATVKTAKAGKLNTPEPAFEVKCDVHPWMQSYVAVMEHPFFAVTDEDGSFEIAGLPAGDYEVEAWHEKLGTRTGSVSVAAGETGTVDFSFDVPQG